MRKLKEKQDAIRLRKDGLSYNEILKQVLVSKSTLSLWLRDIGLAKRQKQRLTEKRLAAARRGWEKIRAQRSARIVSTIAGAGQEAKRLVEDKDLRWIIGTVVYWAEGTKMKAWRGGERVSLTNMDPKMIVFFRKWLKQYCQIKESDLLYALYVHEKADINGAKKFWIEQLHILPSRLRIYFKRHNPSTKRRNIGKTYYGIMNITVRRSANLNHRISGWILGLTKILK